MYEDTGTGCSGFLPRSIGAARINHYDLPAPAQCGEATLQVVSLAASFVSTIALTGGLVNVIIRFAQEA
jgi:hypothetical protein